jgi:hypothetical protein
VSPGEKSPWPISACSEAWDAQSGSWIIFRLPLCRCPTASRRQIVTEATREQAGEEGNREMRQKHGTLPDSIAGPTKEEQFVLRTTSYGEKPCVSIQAFGSPFRTLHRVRECRDPDSER